MKVKKIAGKHIRNNLIPKDEDDLDSEELNELSRELFHKEEMEAL